MIKIRTKRNKITKRVRKSKKLNKLKYGGQNENEGSIDLNFYNGLSFDNKQRILNSLKSKKLRTIENIKDTYKKYSQYDLYDFIYDTENKLIKIWYHGKNKVDTITGGLVGKHIYAIYYKNNNNIDIIGIIGKFIRNT